MQNYKKEKKKELNFTHLNSKSTHVSEVENV